MDLTTTKVLVIVVQGSLALLMGLLPLLLQRWVNLTAEDEARHFWKRTILSSMLCYGGGVLLGASFIHMLPEIRQGLSKTSLDLKSIPMAEILFVCGFFLVYLIEELVTCFCESRPSHQKDEPVIYIAGTVSVSSEAGPIRGTPLAQRSNLASSPDEDTSSQHEVHDEEVLLTRQEAVHAALASREFVSNLRSSRNPPRKSDVENDVDHNVTIDRAEAPARRHEHEPGHGKMHGHGHGHLSHSPTSLRDFMKVAAMSFHSIFEGLAVGLARTNQDVWTLFGAIAAHEFIMSFCMGLELLQSGTPIKRFVIYICMVSLISPMGIGIGIGISSHANEGDAYLFSVAILEALAAGTLVYMVVFEVIQREKSKDVPGLAQLFFIILGFVTIMFFEIFVQDPEKIPSFDPLSNSTTPH